MIMSKSKCDIIHDKAIRLVEGGVVEVDGLCVRAIKFGSNFGICMECSMDCLCHYGTEVLDVCTECDEINGDKYYLELVNKN